VKLFELDGGKTLINVEQIVTAHKAKSGDEWTLYMTDDKTYTVTKHEMVLIRGLEDDGSGGGVPQKLIFQGQFSGEVS
jgi:hypothetical protein